MVTKGEPPADAATDTTHTTDCRHETRLRENLLGFASAETICVECGQYFDADEEQELRHRDQSAQPCDTPQTNARNGYLVG
jgi:hypothetical protein